jgi:diguanylate cyclase (GGDEF)-like protein/PAS domain S-box-containing protein
MNDMFYKQLIKESPAGYAYHKIICDENGIPCDYEFIEVNSAFEALTGLKGSDIIGRKITEVLPSIEQSEFDWIKIYGEVAINGDIKEFEQFSELLKRWYRVKVYSPQKYYFITYFIDVSKENKQLIKMKKLNKILKEREFKYKIIADYAYDWETWEDETGKLRYISPACERISGYTANEFLENQYLFVSLMLEEDQQRWQQHRHCIKIDKGIHTEQFRIRHKNEKVVWIEHTCRPIIANDGMYLGYRANNRDITEQKKVEEEMLESKNLMEVLLESVPAPVFYKDINGRYLGFNRAYEDFFGKTKEELIGKSVFDISPVELASIYHSKDAELFEQPGTQIYETQVKDARGVLHDVVFYKATMVNLSQKVTGLIGTILDITDRKSLETALAKEKNLLETTLISVADGVISTSNKGNIVFLNRVAEYLTGWTQDEARGKSIEEVFNIVNEFTRENSENIVEKVLESGKILELANHTILISKDGIERFIEYSAAPIVQENAESVGVVLVFRDFSEKKQKQEEIKFLSYHDQLTGLHNRRFYEEELKRLDTEKNLPMTIAVGDVNGLKLVNDSFGHAVGDELLKKVAEVLKKGCRADDIIARLGGDEFVFLLPKTDAFEAEQIIKRINDLSIEQKVGSIGISISFGYETKNNVEEKIQDIFKKAEDQMYKKKLFESPSMRGKTIKAIINTLNEKNKREEQHSHRVSALSNSMGEALKLPEYKKEELKTVGLLHDIGKIAIDENILNKQSELTEDEWIEIKRHPEIGYRILSTVNDMSEMAEYVLYHHERWDGNGYPKGLKRDEIPLMSRIIAIVDAYDAMTSVRSYRSALPHEIAITELQKKAGSQFDPELVSVFLEKVLGKLMDYN